MKLGLAISAAALALGLSAGGAWAGADVYQTSAFSPLPITPDATSIASGYDNNTGSSTATNFYDSYTFTIGDHYDTTLSGNFFNKESQSNITSFQVLLFQGIPATQSSPAFSTQIDQTQVYYTATTPCPVTPTKTGGCSYTYQLDDILSRGTPYYLEAIVNVPGNGIGKYGLTAIASPVMSAAPEPGTWALMIAGIAGAGIALRRRRSAGQLDNAVAA